MNIFLSYAPPRPPLFNIIIIDNIYNTNLKEGFARWSLRLLSDKMVELKYIVDP